jgi:hypothetical protein
MRLLENSSTYNLSESKFSLGFAIFDSDSKEFVDLSYFESLLVTTTTTGTFLD